ncbi:MAG TPA: MBL fold metallo-hydrolase [Longimicrobiales bacterium]|nr:MBL fold metallo-hydrolase [Longimicrobiales bacterium]
MRILTFSGGPFAENGYLVVCPATGAAVVVDPGAEAGEMVAALERQEARLEAILLTHAHLDHVEGVPRVREAAPQAAIVLHEADRPLYDAVQQQAAAFGLSAPELPAPDRSWTHGDTFRFGECAFQVRHAPGHSPGHVILVAAEEGVALVGDVVFQGAIGRADLPGGDFRTLMRSIREQVLSLPDETRLLTGHGPETTVGAERRGNPFLIPHYGGELA